MNGIIHVYTYTDIQDPVESSQGSDEDETHWKGSFFQGDWRQTDAQTPMRVVMLSLRGGVGLQGTAGSSSG